VELKWSRIVILPKELNDIDRTIYFEFDKSVDIEKIDSLEFKFNRIIEHNIWGYEINNYINLELDE
jgi:hypothetical protein